jgi:hypothetical protein
MLRVCRQWYSTVSDTQAANTQNPARTPPCEFVQTSSSGIASQSRRSRVPECFGEFEQAEQGGEQYEAEQ